MTRAREGIIVCIQLNTDKAINLSALDPASEATWILIPQPQFYFKCCLMTGICAVEKYMSQRSMRGGYSLKALLLCRGCGLWVGLF
jgi:hypothetical protein